MLSLIPVSTSAACSPGQDISARATVVWLGQKQLSAGATVSYIDPSGNLNRETADQLAHVQAETSLSPMTTSPAVSFVAPPAGAPVYFTAARSFYSGANLAGKCVKLLGRIHTIDGIRYIDDGSSLLSIDQSTGGRVAVPTPVRLRTDLLASPPADGALVTIQGVCRQENDGSLSLLPLSDASVSIAPLM